MRILLVALPEDPRVAQHVGLLRSAGWDVTLASPRPGGVDADRFPAVRVYQPPRPDASGREKSTSSYPVQRLCLAAARVSYRAADGVRALTGLDPGPGPFALRPFDRSGARREPGDVLLAAFGFWPAADATWLASLIERLQPDVTNSFGFRDGIALTFAARTRLRAEGPWLVTLSEDGPGGAEQLPHLSAFVRQTFSGAAGLLAERPDQLDLARDWGFSGTERLIAPVGGGWPLSHCRALRQSGPASERRTIAVSGVQNTTGRAFVALRGIELAAEALHRFRIEIFAANDDVALAAELLQARTGLDITTHRYMLDEDRWRLLSRSRCTLALSDSAMTDFSLMEAAVMGSFPIGSTTDRDRAWLRDGQTALLVWPEDPDAVATALRRAVSDDELIDLATAANDRVAELQFDREAVGPEILALYRRVSQARVMGDG